MTCGHYRTSNKKWPDGYEGWRCKACGANLEMTPKPFDEVVEGILTNPTHVVETGVPDLGKHALRETWRTGTAAQEERKEAKSCAIQRDMVRNGAKLREKDGARHTHSIPRDVYYGAMKAYGKDVWKDKKFKRRFKAFKTTDEKD